MKGKLIVVEGLDGSGKATQTKLLCEALQKTHSNITHISFPDYNQPSSILAKMYLNSEFGTNPEDVNAYAASSFFAVDRYASYIRFWKDKYENGEIIIADRYSTSNCIYQMAKMNKDEWDEYLNWSVDYEYLRLKLPKPDAVIYLDMPTEVSQCLMNTRYDGDEEKKDLHERNIEFLKDCRETAIYTSNKFNWSIINCSDKGVPKSIKEIHEKVLSVVEKVIF